MPSPHPRHRPAAAALPLLALCLVLAGCGDDGVSSEEDARAAYIGLDRMIGKALTLGMDGFGAASSANIPDQTGAGDVSGTLVVGGQVDAGASANKELRLTLTLADYRDTPAGDDAELMVTYDTDATLPMLDLSLRSIPDGTIQAGTLAGTFFMSGDLQGNVTLSLSITGEIQDDGAGGIERVPGSIRVVGTATSDYGPYDVDITL